MRTMTHDEFVEICRNLSETPRLPGMDRNIDTEKFEKMIADRKLVRERLARHLVTTLSEAYRELDAFNDFLHWNEPEVYGSKGTASLWDGVLSGIYGVEYTIRDEEGVGWR